MVGLSSELFFIKSLITLMQYSARKIDSARNIFWSSRIAAENSRENIFF